MATQNLTITGMTCEHCKKQVEEALKGVAGVYAVFVDLAEGSAEVDLDDTQSDSASLIAAVEAAGYGATPAS